MMSLGKEIRKARIDQEMSQGQLAKDAKLSQKYMSQIERDAADPRFSIVQRIAKALGVDLNRLGHDDTPPASTP